LILVNYFKVASRAGSGRQDEQKKLGKTRGTSSRKEKKTLRRKGEIEGRRGGNTTARPGLRIARYRKSSLHPWMLGSKAGKRKLPRKIGETEKNPYVSREGGEKIAQQDVR